jgi:hypothetical protein
MTANNSCVAGGSSSIGSVSQLEEKQASWKPPIPCVVSAVATGGTRRGAGFEMPKNWKKGTLLGSGSFGAVYQGLNLDTGALIALKLMIVPKNSSSSKSQENDAIASIRQVGVHRYHSDCSS